MSGKEDWKCVLARDGAQSIVMDGPTPIAKLCVKTLDILCQTQVCIETHIIIAMATICSYYSYSRIIFKVTMYAFRKV